MRPRASRSAHTVFAWNVGCTVCPAMAVASLRSADCTAPARSSCSGSNGNSPRAMRAASTKWRIDESSDATFNAIVSIRSSFSASPSFGQRCASVDVRPWMSVSGVRTSWDTVVTISARNSASACSESWTTFSAARCVTVTFATAIAIHASTAAPPAAPTRFSA